MKVRIILEVDCSKDNKFIGKTFEELKDFITKESTDNAEEGVKLIDVIQAD